MNNKCKKILKIIYNKMHKNILLLIAILIMVMLCFSSCESYNNDDGIDEIVSDFSVSSVENVNTELDYESDISVVENTTWKPAISAANEETELQNITSVISDKADTEQNSVTAAEETAVHSSTYEITEISDTKIFEEKTAEISEEFFSDTEPFEMLFPVYINGYFEYMDKCGNIVTDYKFDGANFFSDGLAIVCKDEKYGAVDLCAQMEIPLTFDYIRGFHCGMSVVKDDRDKGLAGYINSNGEIIVPMEHISATDFGDDIAVVSDTPSYSYAIDKNGTKLYEVECGDYAFIGKVCEGVLRHHAYFLDAQTGEIVIDDLIDRQNYNFLRFYPDGFSEGLAKYSVPDDFCGEKYIPENDENYYEDSDNWKYGYIDSTGKWVIEPVFDSAAYFSEGLAAVEKDGKRGVIDKTGEFVYYNDGVTGAYSEGYIKFFTQTEKYGFLDKNGNIAIPAKYNKIYKDFRDGLALAELDGNLIYIDTAGNEVFSFEKPEDMRWVY